MCCKYSSSCSNSDGFIVPELLLRNNDTANNINVSRDFPVENSQVDDNLHHSNNTIIISSKPVKTSRRLLSTFFSSYKDILHKGHERKRIKRNRYSVNDKATPVFGNLKLTKALKGAVVKGASVLHKHTGTLFNIKDMENKSFRRF